MCNVQRVPVYTGSSKCSKVYWNDMGVFAVCCDYRNFENASSSCQLGHLARGTEILRICVDSETTQWRIMHASDATVIKQWFRSILRAGMVLHMAINLIFNLFIKARLKEDPRAVASQKHHIRRLVSSALGSIALLRIAYKVSHWKKTNITVLLVASTTLWVALFYCCGAATTALLLLIINPSLLSTLVE